MIERIGEPAMLELLGERCLKLAELAFKQARIKRNQEPTLATEEEISAYMADEWTYVCGFADELKLVVNEPLMKRERIRLEQRWDTMRKLMDEKRGNHTTTARRTDDCF